MPTIISIHGTKLGQTRKSPITDGSEEGAQWWQRGSSFERHLRECVEAESGSLCFQPLLWNGRNSEETRQTAAEMLIERCKTLENRGEPYFLIGHSHGGSIISNALLLANQSTVLLPNMLLAITVGTPFIHLARSIFLSRIHLVLLVTIFLTALNFALLSATTPGEFLNRQLVRLDPGFAEKAPSLSSLPLPEQSQVLSKNELRLNKSGLFEPPSALDIFSRTFKGILAFLALFLIIKLFPSRPAAQRAIRRANVRKTSELYSSRWLGLAHGLDEAVGGLSRVTSVKPVSLFLKPTINELSWPILIVLAAMLVIILGVVWVSLFSAVSHLQPSISPDFISAFVLAAVKSPWQAGRIGLIVVITPLLIWFVVWGFMKVTLLWAAGRLDQLLQRRLLGLNISGQRATAVSSRPMWSRQMAVAMPAAVVQQLTIFDDAHFAGTLRHELTTALQSPDLAVFPNLSKVMSAFQLAHTNYFNSPLFRKLIFIALARQPGLRPTSIFAADPDYSQLRQWLESTRAPAGED
jgi:hypothetical protein